MSLLIDALRQAEQARQDATTPSEQAAPPISTLQLETIAAQASLRQSNEKPSPAAQPAGQAIPADSLQISARQLFETKQPTPSKLPLVVALIALTCLAAGLLYLWWATQPRSQITQRNFATVSPGLSEKPLPVVPQSLAPPLRDETPAVEIERPRTRKVPVPPPAPANPEVAANAEPAVPPLRLKRTPSASQEISVLQHARAAYEKGELASAHQLFREALRADPRNADALTALGTLALRAGRPDEAKRYLREALTADPKNPAARSQLLTLLADSDPGNAESTLQTLIAEQPESPELHFALGGLYARAARWKEAQQAFFQAYSLDNKNPDVLYNLAISLDHLRQAKLARQFYEHAAAAAQASTASFDPAIAQRRAQQLAAETSN
ncbi:MAG: tetratricopeptide repeat protein [Uliginosibacterium sp.]|nr:tetratricopeptide repeat protein [Uliginosibacterium sp.]